MTYIKVKAWGPTGKHVWPLLRFPRSPVPLVQLCFLPGWHQPRKQAYASAQRFIGSCCSFLISAALPSLKSDRCDPLLCVMLLSSRPHWSLCPRGHQGVPKWAIFALTGGSNQPQLPTPCRKHSPSSQRWVPSWSIKGSKKNTVRSAL